MNLWLLNGWLLNCTLPRLGLSPGLRLIFGLKPAFGLTGRTLLGTTRWFTFGCTTLCCTNVRWTFWRWMAGRGTAAGRGAARWTATARGCCTMAADASERGASAAPAAITPAVKSGAE